MIAVVMLAALLGDGATPVVPRLTLPDAERRAQAQSPVLRGAAFVVDAAEARVSQARSALLPQILLSTTYRYGTGNRSLRIGTRPLPPAPNGSRAGSSGALYDYLTGSLTVSQLLYDFGQSTDAWQAGRISAQSAALDSKAARLSVLLDVRLAFFAALARRELEAVAREDLANRELHLTQVAALIEARARPPVDLYQAKADVGISELHLIAAQNDYALAKADLEAAMGGPIDAADFDVAAADLPAVPGETDQTKSILPRATGGRPEIVSADLQIRAGELQLSSVRGSYLPSFHLVISGTDGGPVYYPYGFDSGNLRWNYSIGLALTWSLFEGGRSVGRVREAEALVGEARARKQQVAVAVRQQAQRALCTVVAANKAVTVAATTLENASARLRLANERYRAGAGAAIEVSDAALGYATAAASRAQARYELAAARAQLLHALGQSE